METIYYREKIRYQNRWLLGLLMGGSAVLFAVAVFALLENQTDTVRPFVLLLNSMAFALGAFWLTRLKMKVTIDDERIRYSWRAPFASIRRSIRWREVERCEIVETSELAQWSGGNLAFGRERLHSLTGRNGLSIRTRGGQLLFVGCRRIDELRRALNGVETSIEVNV